MEKQRGRKDEDAADQTAEHLDQVRENLQPDTNMEKVFLGFEVTDDILLAKNNLPPLNQF